MARDRRDEKGATRREFMGFLGAGTAACVIGPVIAQEGRPAGPEEAAEWVHYCNVADCPQRREHGRTEPYNVRLWQIGNGTSYDRNGFDCETAAGRTVDFARAMRKEDPGIQLIGWGDSGWAGRMLEIAGEHLQYIAFHHMFNPDNGVPDSPLRGIEYRKDPARTWEHLMNAAKVHEARIRQMREQAAGYDTPLAMTECHFALPGRNRCDVLSTWAAGVALVQKDLPGDGLWTFPAASVSAVELDVQQA
jgi:alpha-N-arabinofuranosidase